MRNKNEFVKSIQFDAYTLRLADQASKRLGMSRSQYVRLLVREAETRNQQIALPGFGLAESAQ